MIAALAKLHDDAKHRKHIARLQIFPCTSPGHELTVELTLTFGEWTFDHLFSLCWKLFFHF